MTTTERQLATQEQTDRRYTTYLIIVAVAGWALASYDSNLLTLTLPDITKEFHLSGALVGILGFVVFGTEFLLALFVGYGMDRKGRKWMWMMCLGTAAVLTGLTFLVQTFWQLLLVRALASGFAQAELAVSVTLVNEQIPSKRRGFLYSIVQGGWPLGVFMASGVYLLVTSAGLGWRWVYLAGVIPLLLIAIARRGVRESDRFLHAKAVREAVERGDQDEVDRLASERPIDVEQMEKGSIRSMLTTPGKVRNALARLSVVWLLYSTSYVATNLYITYWLTTQRNWKAGEVAVLLLWAGGLGYLFYLLGGWLGEKFGRRNVLVVSGLLVGPLNLLLLLSTSHILVAIIYFFAYQATNGTWSGAGYAYQAENFPTRIRGTAVGWMGAMFVGGLMLGSALWSVLSSVTSLTVTWIVIAVAIGFAQGISTFLLPKIAPGQELEEIVV